MKNKLIALAALLFLSLTTPICADDISDLKKQIEEQNKTLREMQYKLEMLQVRQENDLKEAVAKALDEKKNDVLPDSLKWVENIKINGDFRYRYEMIDEEDSDNRNRNRIRARLGVSGKVNDDMEIKTRLATSESFSGDKGDPVSTNQSLDDAFSKKSIWIDLACFRWSPQDSGLNIFGGKMENPFFRTGGNQLIFDGDLTPEGAAAQYALSLSETAEIFVNGGGFWVNESSGGADTSLWGVQAGLKHTFADQSSLTGGVSYYDYGNIEGSGPLIGSKFQGNPNAGGSYISDYNIIEAFGAYGFKLDQTPLTVFANFINNTSAATSRDTGWLAGGKFGKCKNPGSWEFSYDYRDLEADAVLGAFSDSDFIGGGTDGKGHRFGGTYQLAKNFQGALTFFLNEKSSDSHDYRRLQADMIFKF